MIYPGKPLEIDVKSSLFETLSQDPDWCCEPKWNGWRAYLLSDKDKKITAYNSKGERLSYFKTEGLVIPPNTYLDCEWVDRRTTDVKNQLIIFGIIKLDGLLLEGNDSSRRSILETLFQNKLISSSSEYIIKLVDRFYSNFKDHFFSLKNDTSIEGLVLKKQTSPLAWSCKGQFKDSAQIKVKK